MNLPPNAAAATERPATTGVVYSSSVNKIRKDDRNNPPHSNSEYQNLEYNENRFVHSMQLNTAVKPQFTGKGGRKVHPRIKLEKFEFESNIPCVKRIIIL